MVSHSRPVQTVLQMQLVAVGIALAPITYLVVLVLLRVTGTLPTTGFVQLPEATQTILKVALGAMALLTAIATLRIRKRLEAAFLAKANTIASRTRIVIITMAICDAAAVLGLVIGLLTGDLIIAAVVMAVAMAGSIFHFPTRAWIEQAEDVATGQ
ncbi:MAG TPA: hypothetical protein PLO62_11010 [Candidatus Hydrogenedentes bacterium]|nr:hypothetical protein [Candidatus Hydrogenedentota bacterium]HOS01443.1 hypothetical protein [Candidatus Hydrogenedentota bacterium]